MITAGSTLIPIAIWLGWSWHTYASVLPNTFAAKRNVEIPLAELLSQGAFYLTFSFRWDLVTPLLILGALVTAILCRDAYARSWMAGVTLYLVYVISNGGDFMAGRFLSASVLISVAVLVVNLDQRASLQQFRSSRVTWLAQAPLATSLAIAILALLILVDRLPVALSSPSRERLNFLDTPYSRGIADERGVWVGWGNRSAFDLLGNRDKTPGQPTFFSEAGVTAPLSEIDWRAAHWPSNFSGRPAPTGVGSVGALVGTYGIQLGPTFHIVDESALTDRLLAEQPFVASNFQWRIGHFTRSVPEGYLEAIRSGNPELVVDGSDRKRLEKLWELIR
jgi:arabinofuranosyltransferase